jgi:hypothetical protein
MTWRANFSQALSVGADGRGADVHHRHRADDPGAHRMLQCRAVQLGAQQGREVIKNNVSIDVGLTMQSDRDGHPEP